jgi:hypothetical protein
MTGCFCGTSAGVEVSAFDSVLGTVHVANNTLDDLLAGRGIHVRAPEDTSVLTVTLFNNLITRAAQGGVELPAFTPRFVTTNGYNTFFGSGVAEDWGGYNPAASNRTENPLYVNADGGNFRLRSGSPAVDTGTDAPPSGLLAVDADGFARVIGPNVDRGAYERGAMPTTTTTLVGPGTTTTTLPPGCPVAASFASVACRLGELKADVEAGVESGRFQRKLAKLPNKAALKVAVAELSDGRKRRRAFTKATKALARFARRVQSRKGERTIDEAVRAALVADADALAAHLAVLSGA